MGRGNHEKSRGERNNTSKYPQRLIMLVRERYAEGMELQKIADLYGMPYTSVVGIAYRQNWKHLPSPPTLVAARHTPYTLEQVTALRTDYARGEEPLPVLAERHGFQYGAAWSIVTRRTWKHVPSPDPEPHRSCEIHAPALPFARIAGSQAQDTPGRGEPCERLDTAQLTFAELLQATDASLPAPAHVPGTPYTVEEVTAMRQDYAAGMTLPDAARKHGMPPAYAKRLIYHDTWGGVTSPVDRTIDRRSSITDDTVRTLRADYAAGIPVKTLATREGLRYVTVYAIVTGRNRKDVV
jgi:hypothetical protein